MANANSKRVHSARYPGHTFPVKPWPKLFLSMRHSRRTELLDEFPEHQVKDWLGIRW